MQGNGTVPIRYGGMQCKHGQEDIDYDYTYLFAMHTYIYALANRDGGRPMYFIFLLFL